MSTHTSPSGASAKITFNFGGSTVDMNALEAVSLGVGGQETPSTPENPSTPISPEVPSTSTGETAPDTGFFTASESLSSAPFFVLIAVLVAAVAAVVVIYKKNPHVKKDFTVFDAENLRIRDVRTGNFGKKFALICGGLFSLFVVAGVAVPCFLSEEKDAASAVDGYISVSVKNDEISASAELGKTTALALVSQTVSASTSNFNLYVNVAEDAQNGNYLYLDGDTSKGYIAPTSGTMVNKRALSANEWGFTLSSIGNAKSNGAIWAGVPLYGAIGAANKIHSASDGGSSVTVVYGAAGLASQTPNGAHSTTLVYTAVSGV